MLQEACTEMTTNFDHSFAIFRVLYPWIVRAKFEGNIPADFGTEDHMRQTWREVPRTEILQTISNMSVRNRWFIWNQKMRAMKKGLPVMLLVALYVACVRGRMLQIGDLPYFGSMLAAIENDLTAADIAKPLAAAGAAGSSSDVLPGVKTVKDSNAAMQALRRQCPDNVSAICHVLSNQTTMKLANGVLRISEGLEGATRMMLTELKTVRGCANYHVGMACNGSDAILKQIWDVFYDPAFIADVGFLSLREVTGTGSLVEDQAISDVLVDFARHLCLNEIEASSVYRDRPPYRWSQLLSSSADERRKCLEWTRDLFFALDRAEGDLITKKTIATRVLHKCLWPYNQTCRKYLVGFFETDFQATPPEVLEDLQGVSQGFGTSNLSENGVRAWSVAMKDSPNAQLGRVSRWHRLLASPLLKEFDRRVVEPSMEHKRLAKKQTLNSKDFVAKENQFSLGEEKYEAMKGGVNSQRLRIRTTSRLALARRH